jgi:adenylate cyclase
VFLCQAYGYAGRLREALQAGETALAHIADLQHAHEALMGFSVERWAESLCARILVRTGDFAAATRRIERLIASEKEHPDPAVRFIPHLADVEFGWLTQDEALADSHSRRIDELAVGSGVAYVAVYAAACRGLALSLAGDHVTAIQKLESAIRLAREAYAGLEYESEMLAFLAEVHLRSNSPAAALKVAEEAIAVAVARHARLAECRANIVKARALQAAGTFDRDHQADELFARAHALIAETGAAAYARLLPPEKVGVTCGAPEA